VGKLVPRRRRCLGIDVLAPHLRSCIAVVGEPKLLNLQCQSAFKFGSDAILMTLYHAEN
jgi:hypothetical protein